MQTPSQTVGPFFAFGLVPEQYRYPLPSIFSSRIAAPHVAGEHIRIIGHVFDGSGKPIPDALVELMQADAAGRHVASFAEFERTGFRGFGRCGTGASSDNTYEFLTVKPGSVDPRAAPHADIVITMRGLLIHAYTRLYFDDEAAANAADPVLNRVPAERRRTLLARREVLAGGVQYRFDIHMQGPNETVFFDL